MSRIFISIASFCDPMLNFTIKSLLRTASEIENIHISVVDQSREKSTYSKMIENARISYIQIDPIQSKGACWARALAMQAYDGEDYFLQVDSHSAFLPYWDKMLIEKHKQLSKMTSSEKFVISTRPHPFVISDDNHILLNQISKNTILLKPKSLIISIEDPVIFFDAVPAMDKMAQKGFQISAAFLFAAGSLVEKFPYDPFMYFHGEEQSYSIRLFSAGWDIWHTSNIPIFHMYKSRSNDEPALHWDSIYDAERYKTWFYFKKRAEERLVKLYKGDDLGVYGLSDHKSILDFCRFSKMDINL